MVADARDLAVHWDRLYSHQRPSTLSWYQENLAVSLALFDELGVRPDQAVVDIGGGASTLADSLLRRGFGDLSVLDVSQTALDQARQRLGNSAALVSWFREDVLAWRPQRRYAVWHDRAVFHFLVEESKREAYLATLHAALAPNASVVIGTFAADGPEQCSGLPVARYDPDGLAAVLGPDFDVLQRRHEEHVTPSGVIQPFTWIAATRRT
jgi:2-polyprenyl-3-methyl-5-hydroxy-6-metoxy-1,4-benzoquinol methylase